jgi:hypothetical protein
MVHRRRTSRYASRILDRIASCPAVRRALERDSLLVLQDTRRSTGSCFMIFLQIARQGWRLSRCANRSTRTATPGQRAASSGPRTGHVGGPGAGPSASLRRVASLSHGIGETGSQIRCDPPILQAGHQGRGDEHVWVIWASVCGWAGAVDGPIREISAKLGSELRPRSPARVPRVSV